MKKTSNKFTSVFALFLILFFLSNKNIKAQVFINIDDKGTIYPEQPATIELIVPVFELSYFLINGTEKIDPSTVNYYSNGEDFFMKNTLNSFREDEFLKREIKGNIDIYSKTTNYYNMYGPSTIKKMVYAKGDSTFKKMNIYNLSKDLSDYGKTKKIIGSAAVFRNIGIGCYALGSGLIIASIMALSSSKESSDVPGILFFSGATCFIAAIPIAAIKSHKVKKSVHLYNNRD